MKFVNKFTIAVIPTALGLRTVRHWRTT